MGQCGRLAASMATGGPGGSRDRKVFGKWEMTPVKEWLPQQKACGTGGVMRAGRAGPRMG